MSEQIISNQQAPINNGQCKSTLLSASSTVTVLFVLLIILVGLAVYAIQQNRITKLEGQVQSQTGQIQTLTAQQDNETKLASAIQTAKFQAVFVNVPGVSGGQVYFGHLSTLNDSTYKLTDVYYIAASDGQSLVKLGNEPHKPQDAMYIPISSVTFWENLQSANQFGGQLK